MKKGLSEIIIVLDRSGSMEKIRTDMIGGINSFIFDQKKVMKNCKVSHYQFDLDAVQLNVNNIVYPLYEQLDINAVTDLTLDSFSPRGMTPLYDAVATVIKTTGERLAATDESERPEKILFVIITDGEENASREYGSSQIKQMIEHQTEKYSWEFVYIGANQNAWNVGQTIGVKGGSTLGYVASDAGTKSMFRSLSNKSSAYLCSMSPDSKFGFDEADQKIQSDLGYKP